MEQNLGNGAPGQGSEDNTEATRHVENAEANRDALEAQNRRTESTTDPAVREHPVREGLQAGSGGLGGGTLGTGGPGSTSGSEDTSRPTQHVQNAEANRDALEAQNRRTEATAPPEVREPIDSDRGNSGGGASA